MTGFRAVSMTSTRRCLAVTRPPSETIKKSNSFASLSNLFAKRLENCQPIRNERLDSVDEELPGQEWRPSADGHSQSIATSKARHRVRVTFTV